VIIKNDRRAVSDVGLVVRALTSIHDAAAHQQKAERAGSADAVSDANVAFLNAANVFSEAQVISKAAGSVSLQLRSVAGTLRTFQVYTGVNLRWLFGGNSTAEGGANIGSDFSIFTYNDAGAFLSVPLTILRASGNVGLNTTTPHTRLHVAGPIATAYAAKTAAYTLTAADSIVAADATGAAFTLTLPTAVGIAGREHVIKRINAGANSVTVGTTSAQTIDGAATYVLAAQWSAVCVFSTGSGWLIKSKF